MNTKHFFIITGWWLMVACTPLFSENQSVAGQARNVPNWAVDPTLFTYDGEITGEVFIDTIAVAGGDGILGAFIGDECRGVKAGGIKGPSGKYVFVIRCYSNKAADELIVFKFYDPDSDQVYLISTTITFESNMTKGNAVNPILLKAYESIQIVKPFSSGWTWFSINVEGPDMSTEEVLSSLNPADGDYIKNQTVSSTYYNGAGWFGELTKIDSREMYKVKLQKKDTLEYTGSSINFSDKAIAIKNGWNWIGFLPESSQNITDALFSISPISDDYIKNQTKSNTFYNGAGWFGELARLDPLDGYMLKTSHAGILIFPPNLTLTTPSITTNVVDNIKDTSASCGGNVIKDGGALIIKRGVCWSTSLDPTTDDNNTMDSTGCGMFSSQLTGLISGTLYHVRAYATNSVGTSYGSQVQFTTLQPPDTPAEGIHVPSQTQINWNWTSAPTATGYKWNSINDYASARDLANANSLTETELLCNTAYSRYIWSYNLVGPSSPLIINQNTLPCTHTCGQPMTDSRDGQSYKTVQIGTQCWFAQNINAGMLVNGTIKQTNNGAIEKYCYNNLESNCAIYGGLYRWDEIMDYSPSSNTNPSYRKGICPEGWHVPSNEEWCQLEKFLDETIICSSFGWYGFDAGGKMKETGTIHWVAPNAGATNISGFSALPGGSKYGDVSYSSLKEFAAFWSSTESDINNAYYHGVYYSHSQVLKNNLGKEFYCFSGRCVKDACSTNPEIPESGIHTASSNEIIWRWNAVPNATGYRWNTTDDYNTAADIGILTSKTEDGLSCNVLYARYVWSYNLCGISSPLVLSQTTINSPLEPIAGSHIPSTTQIEWKWIGVTGAVGYKWNTSNDYSTANDLGLYTSKTETGLKCSTAYTRYIWAYTSCGNSLVVSLFQTTLTESPLTPASGNHVASSNQIIWKWNLVSGAAGYKWNTTNNYNTAADMATATTKTETGLSCNTSYSRYVWAYSSCGNSLALTLTQNTSQDLTAAPSAGTHQASLTQIIWKWNVATGAAGYKWGTLNDYATANDMGAEISKTETGLSCNTLYTRYVWAFNSCGHSSAVALTKTTSNIILSAPVASSHVSMISQIIWKWNPVTGASGYRWNIINDYSTSIDMATATNRTESGLSCNTFYTRYVWAYGTCGNSAPGILSQQTYAGTTPAPATGTHVASPSQIIWNWLPVTGATGYKWSLNNDYASAIDMGTATSKTETGLDCNTFYFRFIWAYGLCGNSIAVTITKITSNTPPSVPTAGIHEPSINQIIWKWNVVPDISGYKWNTINDYSSAINIGSSISRTETGLSCNTNYTRYVWAFNSCGNSSAVALSQSTSQNPPASPTAGSHVASATRIVWNWSSVPDALGYKWNVINDYSTATQLSAINSKTETGLDCNTGYARYVWAFNSCGNSQPVALIQATLLSPIIAPSEGAHTPVLNKIEWKWNPIFNATGYKWNTSNSYATATDVGLNTSFLEDGLTPNTSYTRYIWAYNTCDISSVSTLTCVLPFLIGQSYGGGIIFFVDGSGHHGFISATSDVTSGAAWGCWGTTIGTSTGIGSGLSNTNRIVSNCATMGTAARNCYDLVFNGYSDWFLPSKDELYQMYIYRNEIGGFGRNYYSSSSEDSAYTAVAIWGQDFGNGTQGNGGKTFANYVRAIRAF